MTRQPVPVMALQAETSEGLLESIDEVRGRLDDAYWARYMRRPFSWPRFYTWWIARRWVIPRNRSRA